MTVKAGELGAESNEGARIETPDAGAGEAAAAQAAQNPPAEAGAGDKGGAAAGDAASSDEEQAASAAAAAEYKPNWKYVVNRKDKEIPEKYRSLVKSEEDEKELRDLFERAEGLTEHYKPKHEALEGTFSQLQNEHQTMLGSVRDLRETFQRGDIDDFLKKLAIPESVMLKWAVEKYNYEQLPPEQKAQIEAQRAAERRAVSLETSNRAGLSQVQQQLMQARTQLLNSELARPDVKSIVDSFDQRHGNGAFMREVVNRGQLAWFQSKGNVDLAPSQAVEQVISLYGLKSGAPAAASGGGASPANGVVPARANTMTNLGGGRATSPLKPKVRSIDDIKKLSEKAQRGEAV